MRPLHWFLALLALCAVAGVAPAQALTRPNNILIVDRSDDPPEDLLSPEEIERIDQIQSGAVFSLPFSPVSPDDRSVLVTTDEQLGFLDLEGGELTPIDPESLVPFVPLPLLGFSRFSWLDATTLSALALDTSASDPEQAFVRLSISRETLEVVPRPLRLPPRVGIVSVSPDLNNLLLVQLPPAEEGEAAARPIRVPVTMPQPAPSRAAASTPMPPALARQVAAARRLQAAALDRLWLMQDGDGSTVDATPRTFDLFLLSAGRPDLRYVTTIPAASVAFGEAWTRDSSRLAVSFYGLGDAESARPIYDGALLSEEIYRDVTGNMPPSINPILQNNNTYIVDAGGGGVQILRPSGGEAPPILSAHAWAPDNATLLVQAWHPARLKGRTHPIYTRQFSERTSYRFYDASLREVGRLESDLFSAGLFSSALAEFVTPDELIFRAARGTDRHPYYYNRVSGELRNLADQAGAYYNVFSTNTTRQIVFTYNSYTTPPDIYTLGWDGRGLTRLTWLNEELRLLANLRQDPVSFALPGGQVREGVLIQPADAPFPPKNARIVVWQQGGPGVAMVNRWLTNVEDPYALLPGMGVALLVTPVAGRPGYSPAVFNALADGGSFGAIDIDEQAAIVRLMIKRGWTSVGKVGLTGCSYGGYFTLQSLVRHPDLYSAANPQCAWVDVTTDWTRGYDALSPYLEGLPPYNNPEEYRRDSPAYNAARIKAAVLTFHGSEDYLPIVQNENLHLQLVNKGLPARMVTFLGEGHGLVDEENQGYAAQEQISWFRKYLK